MQQGRTTPERAGRLCEKSPGHLVAAALAGAWREQPPAGCAVEFEQVVPLLLASGSAGLGWWRVRHSELKASAVGLELQQAYRFSVLRAAFLRSQIKDTITLLRSGGVEPVLVKGWAVARLYPDQGLRPYGDIDLCVMPQQYRQAAKLLKIAEGMDYPADLHNGFRNLADESPEELYERSQTVELDGIAVRVAAPEDHLRILALHMLRHGVSRPLWLCDVAVALES
ncbi:MAG TPA: nucleotidyltransferase family protein, partial [Blastocatellia bacterium]|nr:nucleotidyltransferase family protein [Blastocatellia bacterium]